MAGAILKPAGDATAGVQVKGITQQYQLSGTNSAVTTSTDITPYDSGTILGTVPPGKAGLKLVDGTIQRATAALLCDSTSGNVGDTLVPTYTTANADPTPPTGSNPADGLSQAPNHE